MAQKYRNRRTNGFASKREYTRYSQLALMQKADIIRDLKTQVPFELKVNDVLVCKYIADFTYFDVDTNADVVEDAKGFRTREYRLKAKLMLACRGIKIREV